MSSEASNFTDSQFFTQSSKTARLYAQICTGNAQICTGSYPPDGVQTAP